jgi:small-conductance mechanosensitive channel
MVDERRRRRTLTPMSGEVVVRDISDEVRRARPRRLATLLRLPHLPHARTTTGAIAIGLVRVAIALVPCIGIALLIDHFLDRSPAIAFYLVGASVLATAFLFAAADTESRYYWDAEEREERVRMSVSYMLVGGLLIAIGVVLESM